MIRCIESSRAESCMAYYDRCMSRAKQMIDAHEALIATQDKAQREHAKTKLIPFTQSQRKEIARLRKAGLGLQAIADSMHVTVNRIRYYFDRSKKRMDTIRRKHGT